MWWTTTICRLPKGSALPREVDDKKVEGENKAVNINMEMEDKKVEGKNRVVAEVIIAFGSSFQPFHCYDF